MAEELTTDRQRQIISALLDTAAQAMEQGNTQEATSFSQQVLALDPGNSEASAINAAALAVKPTYRSGDNRLERIGGDFADTGTGSITGPPPMEPTPQELADSDILQSIGISAFLFPVFAFTLLLAAAVGLLLPEDLLFDGCCWPSIIGAIHNWAEFACLLGLGFAAFTIRRRRPVNGIHGMWLVHLSVLIIFGATAVGIWFQLSIIDIVTGYAVPPILSWQFWVYAEFMFIQVPSDFVLSEQVYLYAGIITFILSIRFVVINLGLYAARLHVIRYNQWTS